MLSVSSFRFLARRYSRFLAYRSATACASMSASLHAWRISPQRRKACTPWCRLALRALRTNAVTVPILLLLALLRCCPIPTHASNPLDPSG